MTNTTELWQEYMREMDSSHAGKDVSTSSEASCTILFTINPQTITATMHTWSLIFAHNYASNKTIACTKESAQILSVHVD